MVIRQMTCSAALLMAALAARSVQADTIQELYNTGVGEDHNLLDNNATSIDPHYKITVRPDSDVNPSTDAHVEDASVFPIAAGPWIPNTSTAQWIAPAFNTNSAAVGLYVYSTGFTLPSDADLSSVLITGGWAVDDGSNSGSAVHDIIRVNGFDIVVDNPDGFGALTPFTLNAGFVHGLNSIQFLVENGGSFTGLMVDNTVGTFDRTVATGPGPGTIPEPATMSLLALGLLGFARRR